MSHPARAFVGVTRGRDAPAPGDAGRGEARRARYERLARVSLRHGYYRASGGACPDFSVRPTAWTATLMRRLGLLFREEAAGFSVLFDRLRERQLLDFLEHDRITPAPGSPPEAWTRLCFALSLRNPWFVNFTALPIDTSPALQNLYLTNRVAHGKPGGRVLLPPGERVSADELVTVTGGQLEQAVDDRVDRVRLLSVSGQEVICKPRCVRPEAAKRKAPDTFDCTDAAPDPDRGLCADRLYFNLTALPEELYTLETVWRGDRPPSTADYLYTAASPVSLGFVELLFSDPAGAGTGVYPVRALGTPGAAVEPVDYQVPFATRRTWWSYYVVMRSPRGERGELRIRQVRDGEGPRAAFLGPCCVRLAGGGTAWRFVSTRPLPLEARSRLHLRLVWRRAGSAREEVLVDPLPVAPGTQVLPLGGARACDEARESLCPEEPGPRCRRLLRSLCRGVSPPWPDPPDFSDIYVHV